LEPTLTCEIYGFNPYRIELVDGQCKYLVNYAPGCVGDDIFIDASRLASDNIERKPVDAERYCEIRGFGEVLMEFEGYQ
jgi:hypothetical protein